MPLSGRYALQGSQMESGLRLWAAWARRNVVIEDDRSCPARAASLHSELLDRAAFVVGPYGSDSTRAVARSAALVWNHGAAADDVQQLDGVVSLPTPASRYLVALARAVGRIRPGARTVVASARGPFGSLARAGLERIAESLVLEIVDKTSFAAVITSIRRHRPSVVLGCGSFLQEVHLVRSMAACAADILYAGVAPGMADFARIAKVDPEGMLATVQWHPEATSHAEIGPSGAEVADNARRPLDYVGAQVIAAATLAEHCTRLAPHDPYAMARSLKTTTFYGAFELDAETGMQIGHELSVIEWKAGRQELLIDGAG